MPTDRFPRTRRALLTALAPLLAALAGCAQIPTSGPIEEGEPVRLEDPVPDVRVVAGPPQQGDSRLEIVRGFFEAMASYAPDYETARLFLAPGVRDAWRPQAGVTVYDGSAGLPVVHTDGQGVLVSAPLVARIGRSGAYERAVPGSSMRLQLSFTRAAGEWRIDEPPQGLVMSAYDVDREFVGYNRYFFDPSFEVVVPDRVYLPINANTATLLVQSLLDGPTRWAPAVRSAFPAGTRLQVASAPVVDGVVQVPLSADGARSTRAQREAMSAQLAWTLRQVPGVTAVRAIIDGVPLVRSDDDSGVLTVDSWQRYDAELFVGGAQSYAVERGRVATLTRGVLRPVEGPFGDRGSSLRSVGAGLGGDAPLAAVSSDGTKGWLADAEPQARARVVLSGSDLAAPSWDRTGLVWFVDRGAPRPLRVFDAGNPDGGGRERIRRQPIRAPALAGEDVRALRVSRDGVRVAVVVSEGGSEHLLLGAVLRDAPPEGRRPLQLIGLRTVPLPFTSIRDVAWANRDQVAVLARARGEELPQVFLVEVGGPSVDSLGAISRPVSLAAAPQRPFLLSTADGTLYRLDDTIGWKSVTAATAPAYPG